ncbi:hypothetical protein [Streptomyces clavuligerus]|uniref:hypothetical protein n=1 Tax=Streptomyces clavuligerus TaxID=1901 RepID=UPI0001851969|nr:hypothetical protein [Streptomyces clavuligerus]WDN56144.1 hypothetical protein LL058_30260 [Streptomyces clavuligerus]
MPKDSRARTRAIRQVMEETGLPYNQATLHFDRTRAATAAAPDPTAGAHTEPLAGRGEVTAARRAKMPPAQPEAAAWERPVAVVPATPGGTEKTSAWYDRDRRGNFTPWIPRTQTGERPAGPVPLPETDRGAADTPGGTGPTSSIVVLDVPVRVVDRYYQGWYLRSADGRYDADRGHARGLETMTYEQLDEARGPLRPVEPPTAGEASAVKAALAGAGRKAAASVLVSLFRLAEQDARANRPAGVKNWLLTGREGSPESATLDRLAWDIGGDLDEEPARYDAAAVAGLIRVIGGWVSGPDRYVEVAANLAHLFGTVADEAGGWTAVADQHLQRHQRTGHPHHAVEAVQRYLMSHSARHPG